MTGEHFSPDIQTFIRLLHEHRVRYLLVGGEAVIHHGYARLTGDVDFFYEATAANARKLFEALEEFWSGDVPAIAGPEDLLAADVVVQFGRPPNRIDLISNLGSVTFASAWRRRTDETMKLRAGRVVVTLPVISIADLIRSKRDAGRHKDLDDVEHLTAIQVRRPKRLPRRTGRRR